MSVLKDGINKVRFMPNVGNPKQNVLTTKVTPKNTQYQSLHKMNFCYAMVNDEMTIFKVSKSLMNYVGLFMKGDISLNNKNILLGNSDIKSYSILDNVIVTSEDDLSESNDEEYDYKNDVNYITNPKNLFDMRLGYELEIEINHVEGFLNYKTIKYNTDNIRPIYKDGDSKKDIYKLWNNVDTLEDTLERYKKEKKDTMLFDEEAENKIKKEFSKLSKKDEDDEVFFN